MDMEAIFDNKTDVLNAKLHTTHDNSVIYAVSTDQTMWTRTLTYVKDMNPALSLSPSHSSSLPPPSYHSYAAPGLSPGVGGLEVIGINGAAGVGGGGGGAVMSRRVYGGSCMAGGSGASAGPGVVVGVINWAQKTFEVHGQRRAIKDIRRKAKGLRNKSRYWKWGEGREEFDVVYRDGGWEAACTSTGAVEGKLSVPYRPHLFGKTKPIVLELSRTALKHDEVFLILIFIYCEVKRQEKT
ncbi:hypothetical protein D9619_001661 [Psilocybe cf. subviscida]|uniref:Uncharacterized protein n=1 Tax=Psilocybe cf. subviscida TaxID=2480587 RepID=A0A8H5BDF7_9AGAR|nr:hypothetical protein D9619_001661 [Psilocybe cf. subviscida]